MSNLDALRARYAQLPDERLEQIAYEEAAGLTPEAQLVLKEELQRRGRTEALAPVEAQIVEMTANDLELLIEEVRSCPCPKCTLRSRKLNAVEIADAKSFVFLTTYDKRVEIGCPECISGAAKRSITITALLGWWGFPWGPIRTIQALVINTKALRSARNSDPTDALRLFVKENLGVAVAFVQESSR